MKTPKGNRLASWVYLTLAIAFMLLRAPGEAIAAALVLSSVHSSAAGLMDWLASPSRGREGTE